MKHLKLSAFLLALLMAASSVLLSCSSDEKGGTESDTGGASDTVQQQMPEESDTESQTEAAPPVVLPPETEAIDTETPAGGNTPAEDDPSQDIPAVEMPDEGEEDPVVTEPDITVEEPGVLDALAGKTDSGRFASTQSKNLVLCIDWASVIDDTGTAEVTVTVGISHYRLFSREKFEMGAIQVDGNAVKFSTPAIEYDENTKTFTTFYTATYTTTRSEMEVEASWQVLGKYGDVEIDTLTAGGTIVLADEP